MRMEAGTLPGRFRLRPRESFPDPVPMPIALPAPQQRDPPERLEERFGPAPEEDVPTVVSVVYVTAPETFDGPAAFVTELGVPIQATRGEQPPPLPTDDVIFAPLPMDMTEEAEGEAEIEPPREPEREPTEEEPRLDSFPEQPERISEPPSLSESEVFPFPIASSSQPNLASSTPAPLAAASGLADSAQESSAAAGDASNIEEPGMSSGGKAGVALSVLLCVGLILAAVLFVYRRKRKANKGRTRLEDEKGGAVPLTPAPLSPKDSIMTARSASAAPRLSLRPLTVLEMGNDRISVGNSLALAEKPGQFAPADARQLSPRPLSPVSRTQLSPGATANDPANPFGNHAEKIEKLMSPPTSPLPPPAPVVFGPLKTDSLSLVSGVLPPGANGSLVTLAAEKGAVGAGATTSDKTLGESSGDNNSNTTGTVSSAPQPDLAKPQAAFTGSPKSLSIGSASSLPLVLGSPSSPSGSASPRAFGQNNVHRVQLDFTPSMDDELEIRAGQLIRLLHEYDDGWALCTRMDQSQQGVVPRTCLSKHPVKPRPAGPPGSPVSPAPHGRPPVAAPPMSPSMQPGSPRGRGPASGHGGPREQIATTGGLAAFPNPPSIPSPRGSGPHQSRPTLPAQDRGRPTYSVTPQYTQPVRSLSPGPYGSTHQRPTTPASRRRSNSASDVMIRRASPPGPSPLGTTLEITSRLNAPPGRKPLPGMAL